MITEAGTECGKNSLQIRLHEDLFGINVPYNITVDQVKANELFNTVGSLTKCRVVVKRGSRFAPY